MSCLHATFSNININWTGRHAKVCSHRLRCGAVRCDALRYRAVARRTVAQRFRYEHSQLITGPPTHSVGGQTSNGRRRPSSLSSSVTLHAQGPQAVARRWRHAASSLIIAPRLHGGPVMLRSVRATPCSVCLISAVTPQRNVTHPVWKNL